MIKLKTPDEIKALREGGLILAEILRQLGDMVEPGINTKDLEKQALKLIKKAGGVPAFKGYKDYKGAKPYPCALCTSINHEVVHAPSEPGRFLKNGDLISLDIGMKYKKLFTDTAITVAVGEIDETSYRLINTTKECLELAIKQVQPGKTLLDIARAVQINAEANGFNVVRELVGHGVGHEVHEAPQVLNYDSGEKLDEHVLEVGLVIAIEPMLTIGGWEIAIANDGITYITKDKSLSAHFEHSIAVTASGHEVLTSLD
ncbi:MAG: type I methionyl aminopeptidase [bacterium]|nr:type I methionyl aminopeptidase [bacterium]